MFARFSVVNRKLFLGKYKEEPTMSVTAKQRRIYDFIRRYIESNQEAPTIAEIGRQFQMRSSASVHAVLIALEREGLIKRIPNVSRGMEIVKQEESDDEDNEIPLLGTVAAGQPIEAILSHDVISVPKDLHGHGRTFALRVRGDSMIEENIQDGDIVVALVDNMETTLKRFYLEPGDRVRLQPANASMAPIFVPRSSVAIQGKVLAVLRKY